MNRKIFTLLVGAIIVIGSAFTVNAQLQYSYKGNNLTPDSTNFRDILTADAVKRLPTDYEKFYYLISVTGVANTSNSSAAIKSFAGSLDSSSTFVLSIDDFNGNLERRLRIEQLAKLDTSYIYNHNGSHKFGALRHSLWCPKYYLSSNVAGSNITYDFTNVETGLLLQSPIMKDRDYFTGGLHTWVTAHDGNALFRPNLTTQYGINTIEPDFIVNGWHFSQTYSATQNLQVNMPMYSYTSRDSVVVFVLDDEAEYLDPALWISGNPEEARTGGWPVTVKHVAVSDLIVDAIGNINVSGPRPRVENVLQFTIKKVNKFVLNAIDWNAINEEIFFDKNATVEVQNTRQPNTKYINPFLDSNIGPLYATEVNDSLYHYGYMQFQTEGAGKTYSPNWLYVDTAWVNWGNNTYLAFGFGPRRDSTAEGEIAGSYGWGDSFVTSGGFTPSVTGGILDRDLYYNGGVPVDPADVYWRMDSIVWAIADHIRTTNSLLWSQVVSTAGIQNLSGGLISFNLTTALSAKLAEIAAEASMLGFTTSLAGLGTGAIEWANGDYLNNLYDVGGAAFINPAFVDNVDYLPRDPSDVVVDYSAKAAIYASYKKDSVNFIWAYMKDSIMENQSKFRVVYDPTADSTFINVYQTRVLYPNYQNGIQNQTWPQWWENSFGIRSITHAGSGNAQYFGTNSFANTMLRPSDAWTGNLYGHGFVRAGSQRTITEAAAEYYTRVRGTAIGNQSDFLANIGMAPSAGSQWGVEGHGIPATGNTTGDRSVSRNGGPSIFNLHSFMEYYPQSSIPGIDRVLISTADTVPLYRNFTKASGPNNFSALSHVYGWSMVDQSATSDGWMKYRDSMFYIDLQNLQSEAYTIITLDQTYKNGVKKLDTQIKINFGTKCVEDDENNLKATIDNDLYLIRNREGLYLTVPLWSITDSVYWVTPQAYEDLTKMPSYQWAVMNIRQTTGSPFRMVNREFERVEFPYVYVYKNKLEPFQISAPYSHASFNNKAVVGAATSKADALVKGSVNTAKFVTELEKKFPLNQYTFIRLGESVKKDQTLGYLYIDKDSTYIDVYAFKFLHFYLGQNDPRYLNWRGYRKDNNGDRALYTEGKDYYDKVYFNLQELEYEEIYPLDSYYNGRMMMTAANTSRLIPGDEDNREFAGLFQQMSTKERLYTNADAVVMERFGFWETNTGIEFLKPMARQAYRMFLQDYYRWHPTQKGHYVTVGEQDRYVLMDKIEAARPYKKGSGSVIGLFGIPHFYYRNTYFDVYDKGDDYFAIVQRLDTARIGTSDYFTWGTPEWGDIMDYLTLTQGNVVAKKLEKQVKINNELGLAVLDIDPYFLRAKFILRADGANLSNISAFQLERDEDPIYRRFHVNEPDGNFYPEDKDKPDILEFHLLNDGEEGYKLFENSGNYLADDMVNGSPSDVDGGRIYNRYNQGTGDYFRDTITTTNPLGNVLSFLGANNSVQFPKTNRAIYVDTAYIHRGTGWIKPQYMLVVDPYIPSELPGCDVNTGNYTSPNQDYVIGRFLYNTSMYGKAVRDSVLETRDTTTGTYFEWWKTDKLYNVYTSPTKFTTGYMFNSNNFNKVEPIKESVIRKPNGNAYLWDGKWERLAFSWAIHKGDSLYVLKGIEPGAFGEFDGDPILVFEQLVKEYGGGGSDALRYIDFNRLISDNTASTYYEAYWPLGDRTVVPEMRLYRNYKTMDEVIKEKRTIGLQAVIALNDNTHKDWVFSFRYVERGSSDFVIESETSERDIRNAAIIRPGYGAWVKLQDDVPVITRSDEKDNMGQAGGSVMNVKRLTNPVSNETVKAASTAVEVIGGTGSVAILNAAGKKVVISNILGQTIANTTLYSNNASIAAPAGFVVVAVEGENAAKVLVK